jgi:hypothetical protein
MSLSSLNIKEILDRFRLLLFKYSKNNFGVFPPGTIMLKAPSSIFLIRLDAAAMESSS